MGKKSKSKKQRQKQQPVQNVTRSGLTTQPSSMLASNLGASATVAPSSHRQASSLLDMHEYIRKDIIRILILLGIVVVVLLGLVVVNKKSTILHRAGSRFARFMQL